MRDSCTKPMIYRMRKVRVEGLFGTPGGDHEFLACLDDWDCRAVMWEIFMSAHWGLLLAEVQRGVGSNEWQLAVRKGTGRATHDF